MVYLPLEVSAPPPLVLNVPNPSLNSDSGSFFWAQKNVDLSLADASAAPASTTPAATSPDTEAEGLGAPISRSYPPSALGLGVASQSLHFTTTALPDSDLSPVEISDGQGDIPKPTAHSESKFSPIHPIQIAQNQPNSEVPGEAGQSIEVPDSPDTEVPQPSPVSQPPLDEFVQLSADQQEYDTLQRVVTAVGNVLLNYQEAELKADRVQTRVAEQLVVAEGNVQLTRGEQVLQGDRLEYQLDQEQGILFKPRGTIFLPSAGTDLSTQTPTSRAIGSNPLVPLESTLQRTQSPIVTGAKESVERLRFEADRIEFTGQNWRAVNIRITSDPFSPPELELRADQAELTRVAAQEDVVVLKRPRLVFDQRISIPVPRSRVVLSGQRQDPFALEIGFDDEDRGGLFLGRRFSLLSRPSFSLSVTPQFFLERAIFDRGFDLTDPDLYGLAIEFGSKIDPQTRFSGFFNLRSVDFANFSDQFRSGLQLQRQFSNHTLSFEAAYRERVLSGSLGDRTIQNRLGAIFSSPTLTLGNSGVELNYRLGAELITAAIDESSQPQIDTFGRFQGSASLRKVFPLWTGTTLPPTATEGLRYTPEPVQPYLRLVTSLTGVASGYTSGDTQTTFIGKVQVEGQFGHFSRPYLDYTGFFLGFSQGVLIGESPFIFDRVVDRQVLSVGILQHLYGPIRIGYQTSINLDTGEFFNSDIILDYSRRTYGLSLRYNPNLQVGAILFRINSFNWVSNRDPLNNPEIGVVEAGVEQRNEPF